MNQSTHEQLEFGARRPQRILVVEKDPVLLHFKVEVLIRHGYEVKTAEDAATAWQELQATNYNLLITDYKLPKMTGIGLIKKLHAAHLALPVVLVAEKMPLHQLVKYPWLQPAATLLKPIAVEVLLATVKNVLRAASKARRTITPSEPHLEQTPVSTPHLPAPARLSWNRIIISRNGDKLGREFGPQYLIMV